MRVGSIFKGKFKCGGGCGVVAPCASDGTRRGKVRGGLVGAVYVAESNLGATNVSELHRERTHVI